MRDEISKRYGSREKELTCEVLFLRMRRSGKLHADPRVDSSAQKGTTPFEMGLTQESEKKLMFNIFADGCSHFKDPPIESSYETLEKSDAWFPKPPRCATYLFLIVLC